MSAIVRKLLIGAGLVVLAIVLARCLVVVDETEYVVVNEFGRTVVVHGDQDAETGLHAKGPWQSVLRIDKRLRVSEPPPREAITGDKRNLDVASYFVWRVEDPLRFLRSARTLDVAEARLEDRLAAAFNNAIGRRDLATLASVDPEIWSLDSLTDEVLREVKPDAREELGIAIEDVRLRQFNYPVEVRPAVFELIRSEREQVAAALRAEGEAQYQSLTSQADRERDVLLAEAKAEAEAIRGQGEAESIRILNEAHGRDPEFYSFLRTLETYRAILDDRATLILSSSSPLLRLLTQGPAESKGEPTSPDQDSGLSEPAPETTARDGEGGP